MEIRKLKLMRLDDVLRGMEVGETCVAPDEVSMYSVRVRTSVLKKEGYQFITTSKAGVQTITRLK